MSGHNVESMLKRRGGGGKELHLRLDTRTSCFLDQRKTNLYPGHETPLLTQFAHSGAVSSHFSYIDALQSACLFVKGG